MLKPQGKKTVLRRSKKIVLNTSSKQMANKHMEVGSTAVVIRKMHIKTTVRC